MELKEVVGVCGNQALIYGERDEKTGVRPLKRTQNFATRGQALAFAVDREERLKERQNRAAKA